MKKITWAVAFIALAINTMTTTPGVEVFAQAGRSPAGGVPVFQVDSSWLKLPNGWVLGQVAAVAIDAQDNVWIIHRFRGIKPELKAAPPVVAFDSTGKFIRAWGGPGDGYEWPASEHGLFVDHKRFVWIGGEGRGVNQVLKFTQDGKFVMQIGKSGQSKGLKDTENFVGPTDVMVWPKTNELFVGDTGGHGRVVVLDADTGKFKRMWGAYGNPPDDAAPNQPSDDGPGAQQFNLVHGIRVSEDGLVYVADRRNNRMQVFSLDGKFQREIFVERKTRLLGTSFSVAFSPDPQQQHLFLADAGNGRVHIYDRKTLNEVGGFGRVGHYAGEFVFLHVVATDSKGDVYTAEVGGGRRVQKFVRQASR